jgi:hypothetical protein
MMGVIVAPMWPRPTLSSEDRQENCDCISWAVITCSVCGKELARLQEGGGMRVAPGSVHCASCGPDAPQTFSANRA